MPVLLTTGTLHRGSSERVGCGERSEPHRSRKTSIDAVPPGHRILRELALAVLVGTGVPAGAKHDGPARRGCLKIQKFKPARVVHPATFPTILVSFLITPMQGLRPINIA
jgi:hypothetical protein